MCAEQPDSKIPNANEKKIKGARFLAARDFIANLRTKF